MSGNKAQLEERQPNANTLLPPSRVRTIMKSSMDTGLITNEVLFLMTKCTEMFVQHLAREAHAKHGGGDTLKYEQLSQLVNKEKNLEFLLQIVPEKIRVYQFKEMLRLNRSRDGDDDDDDDDDDDSGSGSESEE